MSNNLNQPNKIKYFLPPFIVRFLNSAKSYIEFLKCKDHVIANKKFKDIHKGKRCFVIGSGPSVNDFDLTLIKDEILIGLNSFYIHPQFKTIFSDTNEKYMLSSPLHGPDDAWTEEKWKEMLQEAELNLTKNCTLFYGLNNYQPNAQEIIDKNNLFKGYKINYYFSSRVEDDWYLPKLEHIDFSSNLWSASTSSVLGILLALYMGFDEIYLIGVDNSNISLPKDNPRFMKGGVEHENEVKISESETFSLNYFTSYHLSRTLKQYEFMNMLCVNNKIYNCSKSSMADMFPYVDYYEIIETKK